MTQILEVDNTVAAVQEVNIKNLILKKYHNQSKILMLIETEY